jgi:hypothetical protein
MTDDRDTLPGTEPATEPTPLAAAVRQAVGDALAPVGRFLDERSQLMLDVVADAAEARVQVKAAVHTVRVTAWLSVLVLLACSVLVWQVLDAERRDRRDAINIQEARRDAAVDRINAHTDRVCHANR